MVNLFHPLLTLIATASGSLLPKYVLYLKKRTGFYLGTKQAKAFVNHVADRDEKPTCLIHDRDTKFSAEFKQFLNNKGIQLKRLPIRSPNLNARVERFVQTSKYEALNHFIAFGKRHLDYLISEFVSYYNKHRAHSSREYLQPCCAESPPEFETIRLDEIYCEENLGGLIKSYEWSAA